LISFRNIFPPESANGKTDIGRAATAEIPALASAYGADAYYPSYY
jgi:hypothetical protein